MKGIIFSSPMVQAILKGRKDITRRPMKPQPIYDSWLGWVWSPSKYVTNLAKEQWADYAPYKVGEAVYGKETWRTTSNFDSWPPRDLPKGVRIWYEADWVQKVDYIDQATFNDCGKLRSSMFMPETASRIQQKVLSVRAERLQEITWYEAIREGICETITGQARPQYAKLWDSIYGPGSWASNPWVFRYEAQRVK